MSRGDLARRMDATLPTCLPRVISAGSTVKYRRLLSRYPATDGWALTLNLPALATPAVVEPDGAAHVVTILDVQLAAELAAGSYQFSETAELDGERYVTDSGTVEILPDLATMDPGDARDPLDVRLAEVRATISRLVASGLTRAAAHSRLTEWMELEQLRKLEADLVAQKDAQSRGGRARDPIKIAFVRPSP